MTVEYNSNRTEPLVLDRYIYVIVEKGILSPYVIDSYYNKEDAEARVKTIENEEIKNIGYTGSYYILESRLYK